MIELAVKKQLDAADGPLHLDVNCTIEAGSFVALYGPSGAGKTSLLRMLAGLLTPDSGTITMNGNAWFNASTNRPPQERQLGFVFQDLALFPNMTVRGNLEFAQGKSDASTIDELVDLMELGDLQTRHPETLSGGQRQRVALARALAQQPQLLLLDEPLSALDPAIRTRLQDYLLEAHRHYHLTTLMVSHDVGEILRLSDHLLVLENGRIANQGKPADVFGHANISGKFRFTGTVVSIEQQDFLLIVTVLIGQDVVRVVADHSEHENLVIGDKVLVASKAFNPIIQKLGFDKFNPPE